MVMRDLIPDVDARFRTRAEQAGRLLEGFSMGGYGALRLAFAHPTFEARLAALALPHLLVKVPGVGHEALPLMRGMADAYWAYYRTALGVP